MMTKNDLKKRGTVLKPTIQVGKTGFSKSIEDELRSQLEKKGLVKLKVLQSMGPSSVWREDLEKIVLSVSAQLIEIKGGTALIYKRGGGPKDDRRYRSSK